MSIDDEALARLRSLLAKATPGPWYCGDGPGLYQHRIRGRRTHMDEVIGDVFTTRDAALITAMRKDIEALLDIAEAVARAPVAKVMGHAATWNGGGTTGMTIQFDGYGVGPELLSRVRIVPCTGGGE